MCERDLGELGETAFRGWCNAVGITIHKVEKDRTGWDFFIEFPWEKNENLPRDMFLAPIDCKVQVKATDQKNKSEKITVSNLSRLIKFQGPVFFCLIEFDGKDQPQSAYLVHVGEKVIGKTLKKIRELDVKGKGDKLNKHTICIRGVKKDLLPGLTGQDLKKVIEGHLPNGLCKYVEHKNELLNTLGFEEGKGQITITLSGTESIDNLVDLSLGIREEVCIDRSVGYFNRFGILSENKSLSFENAAFSIRAKPVPAILRFKEHKFSAGLALDAELYLSSFAQFLPDKYLKLRAKTVFFDIVAEPFREEIECPYNFKIKLPFNERFSLLDLTNHLKIFGLLNKKSSLLLEIYRKGNGELPCAFNISINVQVDNWTEIHIISEMASSICRSFSIMESEVLVSIDELLSSADSICNLRNLLYAGSSFSGVNFTADLFNFELNNKFALAASVILDLGNHKIICCVAIIGYIYPQSSKRYEMPSVERTIVGNELILKNNEFIEQKVIDERLEAFANMLQNMDLTVAVIESENENISLIGK